MYRIVMSLIVVVAGLVASAGREARAEDFSVKAYDGQPFGVALIVRNGDITAVDSNDEITVAQLGDGALYPVNWGGSCRFLYDPKSTKEVMFRGQSLPIRPTATVDNGPWKVELELWWNAYKEQVTKAQTADNMPLQIDQYLVTMLARRLKQPPVDLSSRTYLPENSESRFVALMSGAESVRVALQRETLLQTSENQQKTTEPLPEPVLPRAVEIPEPAADVVVEPLAMHVPAEYFYVRLASYEDLTWARRQIDQLGTDVRDLMNARGFDYHMSTRIQDQLELHDTAIAQLLGPHVLDDIAIIGTDTFLREGASIGVLFHAKVNEVLAQSLDAQRLQRAKSEPGATLTEVTFDGDNGKHSLLATPDHRVRSYYVRSGDFHLITTSHSIANRFLEVSRDPESSLGALKEFRYARTVMPLSREDHLFVHLSDPFFRTFINPQTRIEMTRRAKSDNEMELVRLAVLAANAEKRPSNSIAGLIEGGFLPNGFGQRADGSVLQWDGVNLTDSVRGARGSFLPVNDVRFDKVTRDEVAAYQSFAQMYMRLWQRVDPASIAVRRVDEGDRERMVIDLHVCPFPLQDYAFLSWFQKDTTQKQLAPIDGVLAIAEANVMGTHAVAGLVDTPVDENLLKTAPTPNDFGLVPLTFVGDRRKDGLPFGIFGDKFPEDVPDDQVHHLSRTGYSNYGLRSAGYTFWSEKKESLSALAGKIKDVDAARKAKIRVQVADISHAQVSRVGHVLAWIQARKVADGNVEMLNRLASQFRVKPDEAASAAAVVFNATPVSPLNGMWTSEPGQPVKEKIAVDRMAYRQPFLNRLRGAVLELDSEGNVLTSHVELVLDKQP